MDILKNFIDWFQVNFIVLLNDFLDSIVRFIVLAKDDFVNHDSTQFLFKNPVFIFVLAVPIVICVFVCIINSAIANKLSWQYRLIQLIKNKEFFSISKDNRFFQKVFSVSPTMRLLLIILFTLVVAPLFMYFLFILVI